MHHAIIKLCCTGVSRCVTWYIYACNTVFSETSQSHEIALVFMYVHDIVSATQGDHQAYMTICGNVYTVVRGSYWFKVLYFSILLHCIVQ
jgi:hypothetical protein